MAADFLGSLADDHPDLAFGLGIATLGASIYSSVTARNNQQNGLIPRQVPSQQSTASKPTNTGMIVLYIAIAFLGVLGIVVIAKD